VQPTSYIAAITVPPDFGRFTVFPITMAATRKNTVEIEKAKKLDHVPWCDEYEKMISGML
jgi:hypothetical protein